MATGCAVNVESDSYCSLCRVFIVQGEYLIRISLSPAKKPVMLGVMDISKKWERKNMKKGMTVGFMAMFAGVLLATVTSVYANHAATGKGTYAVAPQILSRFHFVVARGGLNFVESEMARIDDHMSFTTFMISTAIASFTISTEPAGRTVTITGEIVSTTFLGVGPERQPFAELVPFTAIGVDKETPEAGADLFSLIIEYRPTQVQGPLFASLGLGECDATTCTITFAGPVKTGDIFVHTAGDE
ncbi:MAG: hypothetical protein ACRERE_09960 [Candidatus Entotheonellia bacterium]